MKVLPILFAMFFAVTARSQNTINNYKYVLVPERFDFFKTNDQYGLNSQTKAYLQGIGFTAVMDNEALPAEVAANKCTALKAEVVEKKKFLTTGLTIILKDCQGNVVYKSEEGKSREKEWPAAYSEALRNAFTSLSAAQYKYDPNTTHPTPVTSTPAPVAVTTPAPPPAVTESKDVLYAQANANGYQLIDTSPKKVMTLLKTSQQDHFIADDGASKGIVFRKNGEWFFEYYKDDKLVSQKLNIKF